MSDVHCLGNGSIEFHEFLLLIANRLRTEDVDEELKDAFRVFDKNHDGLLSASELRDVLATLGEEMCHDEIDELIAAADKNHDGQIDYTGICYNASIRHSYVAIYCTPFSCRHCANKMC